MRTVVMLHLLIGCVVDDRLGRVVSCKLGIREILDDRLMQYVNLGATTHDTCPYIVPTLEVSSATVLGALSRRTHVVDAENADVDLLAADLAVVDLGILLLKVGDEFGAAVPQSVPGRLLRSCQTY